MLRFGPLVVDRVLADIVNACPRLAHHAGVLQRNRECFFILQFRSWLFFVVTVNEIHR